MPTNRIYPKAIDLLEYSAISNITNTTPYISIVYSLYENINLNTGVYDSKTTYAYFFALNSFSYNYVNDADSGEITTLCFSCNNIQLQFNLGEIVDLNGNTLSLSGLLGPVTAALGI